jgi:hypothetical protein
LYHSFACAVVQIFWAKIARGAKVSRSDVMRVKITVADLFMC